MGGHLQLSVLTPAFSESNDHYLKYINLRFVHSTTITYQQRRQAFCTSVLSCYVCIGHCSDGVLCVQSLRHLSAAFVGVHSGHCFYVVFVCICCRVTIMCCVYWLLPCLIFQNCTAGWMFVSSLSVRPCTWVFLANAMQPLAAAFGLPCVCYICSFYVMAPGY